MRRFLAGILFLFWATLTWAQPKGEVESIGIGGRYRADCWTPMVVRLTPGTTPAGTYQLQVRQYDTDGDRPIYSRTITLNAEDVSGQQRFWMYFVPQPIEQGLPDQTDNSSLKALQRVLKVHLASADGKKLIAELPVTSTVNAIEKYVPMANPIPTKGKRFILCVTDGSSQVEPTFRDYSDPGVAGFLQDIELVRVKSSDLPDNVLGYEAIDAILWMNADPADLERGGENKLDTLREYVRTGGKLIVCTSGNDWQRSKDFGDLLPVVPASAGTIEDLNPLKKIARARENEPNDPWNKFKGAWRLVRATPRKGANVEEWINWDKDGKDRSPWLVRRSEGLGAVTWVAQDLGDPSISGKPAPGWVYVWDRVFDWKNNPVFKPPNLTMNQWDSRYDPYETADLGRPTKDATEIPGKSVAYVSIALLFFAIYWAVAGPGSFLFLRMRGKAHWSWIAFCLAAVVATFVTVLLVKLLLRGSPELRHLTFVKVAPNEPAMVYTRFGLYIPEDGDREIELKDVASEHVSQLNPYATHPSYATKSDESGYKPGTEYVIPVREKSNNASSIYTIPYRSTLKRFSARWRGDLNAQVGGDPRIDLTKQGLFLAGNLTNATNVDLVDVYLAFQITRGDAREDRVIYLPTFNKGQTLDLSKDLNSAFFFFGDGAQSAYPRQKKIISSVIGATETGWSEYWYRDYRRSPVQDDSGNDYLRSFPMLSFFDRLPVVRKDPSGGRFDLTRRNAVRPLDMSQVISAGNLVVLGRANGAIPIPLEVQGNKIEGTGTTLYQFVVPLDRSALDAPPATQPSSTPR